MKQLNKKKIILTYEFGLSSYGYGGGQSILLGLAKEYSKNNFEVYVITPESSNIHEDFKNLNCFFIYSKKYSNQIFTSLSLAKSFFKLIKKFSCTNRKNLKVLSFTSEAFLCSLISKINNIKFYTYLAAPKIPKLSYFLNLNYVRKNILLILFLLGAKLSKKCFCISNFILLDLKKNLNFKNLINVNCGIDYKFLLLKNKIKASNKKLNLFYVGRLAIKQKPVHLIIDSLKKIKSFSKLYIAGSGPDKNKLLKLVKLKKLRGKVIFLGNLDKKSIIKYSRKCHITVLISNYESFMISAYEMAAISNKLAISDVAGLKKKFRKFKGIVFIKNNVNNISMKINNLYKAKINNYNLIQRKNYIQKNFTWPRVYDQIEKY